jgi:hypothetical protein
VQQILKDLKQYRPNRRPMTSVPEKYAQRHLIKRKRKLLVRDWFFFVVWYIRLKKILKGVYQKETMNNFLMFNPRYKQLLEAFVKNPDISKKDMKDLVNFEEVKRDKLLEVKVRVESVCLNIHRDQSSNMYPLFELNTQKLSLDYDL